jgi:hypothetical protein
LNVITEKLKEVITAVLPITIIVIVLNFTLTPLEPIQLTRFIFGALFIVIGLAVFLLGVDIAVTPIGKMLGKSIVKPNKIWLLALAGVVLGLFISIAEPDLHILAQQVDYVSAGLLGRWSIVIVVSLGVGVLIAIGLIRIVLNIPLYKMLIVIYLIIGALAVFSTPEFLAIAFDASGATTGALTVPFILALAVGITAMKKDSKASEKDSFGLVAIASAGAIIAVLIMSIVMNPGEITGTIDETVNDSTSIFGPFLELIPESTTDAIMALLPIIFIFIFFQFISFKLPRKGLRAIFFGFLFVLLGLALFLVGVNAGFLEVGRIIGYNLATFDNKLIVVGVAFVLGFVIIMAEPAVYVLTKQIEDVTSGYVRRKIVMAFLSIGVGTAVALSSIRVLIPELHLWHFLLPGYAIALAMTFFVPKLFVGIAFDSGGVASGPMTATFILAFAQGTAAATEGANVLIDGFGVIAMVALMPIIALQILGIIFKIKSRKQGVAPDE